jgi:hypothetical protein
MSSQEIQEIKHKINGHSMEDLSPGIIAGDDSNQIFPPKFQKTFLRWE